MKSATRAISIRQPYVELILQGKKRREFRSRRTNIRGRVYIYASLKLSDHLPSWRKLGMVSKPLPTGVIVGSVEIVDCCREANGDYGYILANPKRLGKHLRPKNQPQPVFWFPEF